MYAKYGETWPEIFADACCRGKISYGTCIREGVGGRGGTVGGSGGLGDWGREWKITTLQFVKVIWVVNMINMITINKIIKLCVVLIAASLSLAFIAISDLAEILSPRKHFCNII